MGDQSAVAGAATADMTCDVKHFYGFSVDIAFVVAFNSDPSTIANPIMKIEVTKENSQFGGTPVFITNADQIGGGSPAGELSVNLAKIGGSPVAESALKVDLDKVKGGVVDVKVNAQAANLNVEVKNSTDSPVNTKEVPGA